MSADIEKVIEEIQEIADSLIWKVPEKMPEKERIKIAVQIQRNKILEEELSAIYSILDDIRYNRIN